MRITSVSILLGLLLPAAALAASSSSASSLSSSSSSSMMSSSSSSLSSSSSSSAPVYNRRQAEEACKVSTGYTDEQLKNGTFLEIYRKCVNGHLTEIKNRQVLDAVNKEKKDMIDKATAIIKAKYKGRALNQRPPLPKGTKVKPKTIKRLSPRSRRESGWESGSISEPLE